MAWLLLDAEPASVLPAWLQSAVDEGSYLVSAPETSRLMVDDHIFIAP
jgi:hypothetical protein